MQPMPLLTRQVLRSAFALSKPTARTPPRFQRPQRPSTCIQSQARAQATARFYSTEKDPKPLDDTKASQNTPVNPEHRSTSSSALPPLPNHGISDLPSRSEAQRSALNKRLTHIMDNMQSSIFTASQRLNDLTGYSGIDALRREIEQQESSVASHREGVRVAKDAYTAAISLRSKSQREVNELLQRKNSWSPQDLERFTSLYRSDHTNEQAEMQAQEALSVAERDSEEAAARLSKSILARYHEEQIWSDKIRRMSTWGTWGLMGVNVLLFLVFQVAVEPWRRRRLVKGFEEKVMEALDRDSLVRPVQEDPAAAIDPAVMAAVDTVEPAPEDEVISIAEVMVEDVPVDTPATIPEPTFSFSPQGGFESYKEAFRELFSERRISLTQKEATTLALEGAAAGAALTGLLLVLLRPK